MTTKIDVQKIVVDGETYVKESSLSVAPRGPRAVLVVDRGFIFAGDVTEENGRIYLDNAIHVFSWQNGGITTVIADPKKAGADLRPCSRVDVPKDSEVFRMPVPENWGK